ncbi:MAG: oligosaccharide flippase family protein [Mycoplasmatota bacterium]
MKKSKFIKSTLILIIGGFFTKILGMVIRIITNRMLGVEGVGIYMMIMPSFMLFMALAQLGLPTAISKLVAEEKHDNKALFISTMPLCLLLNLITLIFMLFCSGFIANYLLNEPATKIPLMAIGFVLPFITISSMLRGYFFGKEKMIVHVLTNILEDITKLIALIIGIPFFSQFGVEITIVFIILTNILSELSAIIVFLYLLPKKIKKEDLVIKKDNVKKVLNIGVPTTLSRLIGSFGYFLEPIILSFLLLQKGFDNTYIITNYGILSGFVMPILLLPSFFSSAISHALIPVVSKSYSDNNLIYTKNKIIQSILISLLIGIPATIIFLIFPNFLLDFLYNTNEGVSYIRILAPFFIIHYIQSPIASSLQAMGFAKEAMKGTFFGMLIKTASLIIFTYLFNFYGLIISSIINIIFVTTYQIVCVSKHLNP